MADKRAPGRSLDEWMKLVTECRQSGLTDAVNITVQMYPCSEGTDTGNPVL